MTSTAQSQSVDSETQLLAGLKARYLAEGFTFEIQPDPRHLPPFLGTYAPDAVARKQGLNVAIEVRQRRTPVTELKLKEIRRLFEGHPDWQFVVAYAGDDPTKSLTITASPIAEIRKRLDDVRALEAKGELRSAFIFGWSLLEASLQKIENSAGARPRTPGTVIQTLTMLGYIDPEVEPRVRSLVMLRNRLVHGDLTAEPSVSDVKLILDVVDKTLSHATA